MVKKIQPKNTLGELFGYGPLASWINKRVKDYRYPGRAGIPKGSPLPLTSSKYKVSHFPLYSDEISRAELAKAAGVSYHVYSNWRAEERFNRQVKRNVDEYTKYFLDKFSNLKKDSPVVLEMIDDFIKYSSNVQLTIARVACIDRCPSTSKPSGPSLSKLKPYSNLLDKLLCDASHRMNRDNPLTASMIHGMLIYCYIHVRKHLSKILKLRIDSKASAQSLKEVILLSDHIDRLIERIGLSPSNVAQLELMYEIDMKWMEDFKKLTAKNNEF
jgi:hypothetical protein